MAFWQKAISIVNNNSNLIKKILGPKIEVMKNA